MLKKILCFSLLWISCAPIAFSQPYTLIEDRCGLEIATPSLLERKVSKLRLENGLEVFLISDPGTHQSGAALAVEVGSWNDPKDRPGMAHFVEHMLFLGTEKYPIEEDYHRYLDEHAGQPNAYTMADRTVYMFSVNNEGFEGALDRFAQFFIAPLFNPSGVDRESKAIDQEFSKDVPLDHWRVHYVKKELANPHHPFHRFCIGNKDTLAKISQEELKEWYHTHYSADLMHLAIYSSLPLSELETQVSALFSKVKKIDSLVFSAVQLTDSILTSQTAAKMVIVSPVQELQKLELSWELPLSFGQDIEVRADDLISYVLGHEGKESLLAQLKREELAESLASGSYKAGKNHCFFQLSIQLTAKGIENQDTVIQRCFEALASFRSTPFPKYLFEEIGRLKTLEYSYQQREEIFQFVSDTAFGMVDEPLETFPHKSLVPSTYAPEKVQELFNLMTPERCHYTLIAPPKLSGAKMTQKEKWMGVEYSILSIPSEKLSIWSEATANPHISFPSPNRFIPQKIGFKTEKVSDHEHVLPTPSLLVDKEGSRLYYSHDDQYLVPEGSWIFTFKTPEVYDADPKSHALADLYCHTVKEKLNAVAYEAQVAGLYYDLSPVHNGIKLTLSGYSEKASEFLSIILKEMKQVEPTLQEFTLYKNQALREYTNEANKTPVSQGIEVLWSILYKDYSGANEKQKALKTLSYEDFSRFTARLFTTAFIEGIVYGNLSPEETIETFTLIENALSPSPFPYSQHPKIELAVLPNEKDPAFIEKKSSLPGSAVLLTADCGEFSFERRAAHEILSKGLEEPFFSELRTRQQTAYLVANWSKEIERHLYSFFLVQSGTHDTRDLLARFELFLESSLQNLTTQTIPKERFEAIRTALITQLEHPAQNMEKMGEILHSLAFEYDGDFKWLEKRIQGLKDLSYESFQTYAQQFLGKENRKRMAICINGTTISDDRFRYRKLITPQKIRSEIQYRGRG